MVESYKRRSESSYKTLYDLTRPSRVQLYSPKGYLMLSSTQNVCCTKKIISHVIAYISCILYSFFTTCKNYICTTRNLLFLRMYKYFVLFCPFSIKKNFYKKFQLSEKDYPFVPDSRLNHYKAKFGVRKKRWRISCCLSSTLFFW